MEYDLIVIGAGAAGLTAASFAAKMGARVAMVEKNRLGGDCTWTGCVPSKTLLHIAKVARTARRASSMGLGVSVDEGAVKVDMRKVRDKIMSVIHEIYAEETPEQIAHKGTGVDVVLGEAQFTGPHSVVVKLKNPEQPIVSACASKVGGGAAAAAACSGGEAAEGTASSKGKVGSATAAAAGESEAVPGSATGGAGHAPPTAGTGPDGKVLPGHRHLTGKAFVIATGAVPSIPALPGLGEVKYHTYESIFENDRLPERLCVLGTGPIGCELAQAYAYLGSKVTIFGRHLMGKEHEGAREVIRKVFEREGIDWVPERPTRVDNLEKLGSAGAGDGAGAASVEESGKGQSPAGEEGGGKANSSYRPTIAVTAGRRRVVCDMLLVCTGRRSKVDGMELGKAGVTLSAKGGLKVSDYLATNAPHVFACGDCIEDMPQFTHLAGKQGFVAARNALFPGRSVGWNESVVNPRCTFTDPEVASVGLQPRQAEALHGAEDVMTVRRANGKIDRSLCDDDVPGFVEMTVKRSDGSILGATIVGQRAGELVSEVALAMTKGLKAADIALTIHAYPTHSIGLQQVASEIGSAVFRASTVGRIASSLYSKARIVRDHSSLAVDEHDEGLAQAVPMPLLESTEEKATAVDAGGASSGAGAGLGSSGS